MRNFVASALALTLAFSAVRASTVALSSSATGRTVTDTSLNALPDGDLFMLGTFSTPGNISLSKGSVASILSAGGWSQFAPSQSLFTSTIFSSPGKLNSSDQDNTTAANAFSNLQIYIIVFNASSASTATQMGIFTNTGATTGDTWFFPTNGNGLSDSITIKMDDTHATAVGGVGSVSASPQRFTLSALVPEPSGFGLMAMGAFSLMGYRRLRRLA
jgi:hypothetical protein